MASVEHNSLHAPFKRFLASSTPPFMKLRIAGKTTTEPLSWVEQVAAWPTSALKPLPEEEALPNPCLHHPIKRGLKLIQVFHLTWVQAFLTFNCMMGFVLCIRFWTMAYQFKAAWAHAEWLGSLLQFWPVPIDFTPPNQLVFFFIQLIPPNQLKLDPHPLLLEPNPLPLSDHPSIFSNFVGPH